MEHYAAPSSRMRSPRATFSPQPDDDAPPSTTRCGKPDAGLRRAAEVVLAEYTRTARLVSSEDLEFALRSAGVPYVWTRSMAATGPDIAAVDAALASWSNSLPASSLRRCGLALVSRSASVSALALAADVVADVSPVRRAARVGQWLPFTARLHVEATEVALLALGPRGTPHKIPVQLTPDGLVTAQLPIAAAGRWLFQLLPTTADGPRPVAEVEVFADVDLPHSAEQHFIPGDTGDCQAAACGSDQLVAMLNQARASEKLPPLWREARLHALAARHAHAMMTAARLAHDVGDGDAYIRVSPEFPEASLLGENIAHAADARAAHRALWMSPAHRQNLLRREYAWVGVGVALDADGSVWVCQLFAAQTAPSATY